MTEVGWLILLPPGVGKELLLLCSVNYTSSLSIILVHLPHLDPAIAPTGSSPASAPPPCTVHRPGGRPPSLIWLSAASSCTPWWGGDPRLPLPHLQMGTPTILRTDVIPVIYCYPAMERRQDLENISRNHPDIAYI